jgi:release factor glutamine methyltransferase
VILFQKAFRKFLTPFYKPVLEYYLKKTRIYFHKPFKLIILPGVFHPAFFYSTKFLWQYLKKIDFVDKNVVEVGAGSGLISFNLALSAKKVYALELSQMAIEGLLMNQQSNSNILPSNVLKIVHSNLFNALETCVLDYIIVNPPYYPNKVKNEKELAWNCGEEFEYFTNFFNQVRQFMNSSSKIIMVLSSQCNLQRINDIANKHNFSMQLKAQKEFLIESNFIYEITAVQ